MIAAKFLTTALFLTIATLTSSASATVVDFNNLAGTNLPGNTNYMSKLTSFYGSTGFTTNGFNFKGTDNNYSYLIGANYAGGDSSDWAYNGTDFFIAASGFSITSATAAPFSINSIDLGRLTLESFTTATLTGTKVGGGIVTTTVTLDITSNASKHTGNDFLTYSLTGFDNLSSLSITHNGLNYLTVDNVVLNAATVPEPSSIALFGLALAAGALVRRRA